MSLNALLANHEDVTNDLIPEYIKHAPESVRRRIRALKKLQLKSVDIQAEFYKKVHELETEFRAQFDTVNSQVTFSSSSSINYHHFSAKRLSTVLTSRRTTSWTPRFSRGWRVILLLLMAINYTL